jgi:hypothetical protein
MFNQLGNSAKRGEVWLTNFLEQSSVHLPAFFGRKGCEHLAAMKNGECSFSWRLNKVWRLITKACFLAPHPIVINPAEQTRQE